MGHGCERHTIDRPLSRDSPQFPETRALPCVSAGHDAMHEFTIGHFNFRLPESLDSVRPIDFAKPCDQMLVVELFAGTATLSSELRKAILAVDKSSGRNPSVKLVELDVTAANGQTVLLQTLLTANVAYFHGAPPCGTASRARDKPLPSYMEHIKAEPLRFGGASPWVAITAGS